MAAWNWVFAAWVALVDFFALPIIPDVILNPLTWALFWWMGR